ncbi:MAG: M23 family metallopeptidase [Anaerolineae bacterium]|nr:M23 family metallopeptidase [Anaerolineae bacterium]
MHRLLLFITFFLLMNVLPAVQAQEKPFSLPVAEPPGPATWLFGQPYGNTTGSFNFGQAWYSAGQGLHFGIDLSMACGTPLVAMAEGEVLYVDNLGFGSAPHNLLIRHDGPGLVVLYGHLLDRAPVEPGQLVQRGDVVGYSGDPDVTCDSRPHLHLEIRSLDYRTLYNPVDYIDAPWHTLATIGSFGYPLFQQDMLNPRQWMNLDDQPDVVLGGRQLNAYSSSRPLSRNLQPSANPPLAREVPPLEEGATFSLRSFGFAGCCAFPTWHPTNPDLLYVVDGSPGQQASTFEWSVSAGAPTNEITPAPPPLTSPDGSHTILYNNGTVTIQRNSDGASWNVQTNGRIPVISTDNSRLMWEVRPQNTLPGQAVSTVVIWVSDILGQNAQAVVTQSGGSARWLDASRLLISKPQLETRANIYTVVDTADGSSFELGTWEGMRGLSVSPGGGRLLFYITRHGDPEIDGLYTIETQPGAQVQKLDWFGAWQWRDANSVYYVPFDPTTDVQRLAYCNFATGEQHDLTDPATQPFTIGNGDWSVAPDGRKLVFYNAIDRTMWLIEENE